ncbi:MAG: response regulator transcription factor [Bdellovibrionales bacterium]|nr:response regulator transcription factor [Bdellovibrionales bacterium]
MIDAEVHAVAKFFFLTLKDHRVAHEATRRSLLRINKIQKNNKEQSDDSIELVFTTYRYWKMFHKPKHKLPFFSSHEKSGNDVISQENKFFLPKDLSISAWNQFMKDSKEDELLLVTWSRVLNISDGDIARGLGLSEGTVRYRVANGLKKLGKSLAS